MPLLKYWDGSAWQPLVLANADEVRIAAAAPTVSGGAPELWLDTATEYGPPSTSVMRTRLEAPAPMNGPWPKTWTINVPFKADVLFTVTATVYGPTGAGIGIAIQWDGAGIGGGAWFFNEASSHKPITSSNVVRNVIAGNHTISVHNWNGANSDSGDQAVCAVMMAEVP